MHQKDPKFSMYNKKVTCVFERNSLKIKNKTKPFSIKFGNALKFHDDESIESITNQIEKIID